MDSGVSTLLGAVIGGGLSFGGSWLSQRGLDKRERDKQRQEDERASLISARILQEDLVFAETRIMYALKNGRYWSERYALRQDAWLKYRESLAVALPIGDWSTVRDGFRATQAAELGASRRRNSRDPRSRASLTDQGRELLKDYLNRVQKAITALEPVAKDRYVEDEVADESVEIPLLDPAGRSSRT